MMLAMLMVMAMMGLWLGGGAAALAGGPGSSRGDEGLRRLRAHAARSMVLAWCTGEHGQSGPTIFSAAMAHAKRMQETRAMLVAADHQLAVKEMAAALEWWGRGGR